MIPRRRLYIGWSDLLFGLGYCLWATARARLQRHVEESWLHEANSIVCVSLRSGFDLLLQALNLPRGSEILVSAVTIPAMVRLIEQHGLVPVPIDLNMQTLAVKPESLKQAISEKTRAIVVAHLFGSRMPLDDIVQVARQHGLYLIEDCAQVYIGNHYRGHPDSDVSMFSFDPAKTNTALGGGLLRVKEPAFLRQMKRRQAQYPIQRRWQVGRQLGKYAIVKLLYYPPLYGLLCRLCRVLGTSHEHLMMRRKAANADETGVHRLQPSAPLLALLARRLQQFDPALIEERIQVARTALTLMPSIRHPGARAAAHTHWVLPICVERPEQLQRHLWQHGFDATRVATQLAVVEPPTERPELHPLEAQQAMEQILYLPVYPGVSARDLLRLADAIRAFEVSASTSYHN
jgi:perosamine synthetase